MRDIRNLFSPFLFHFFFIHINETQQGNNNGVRVDMNDMILRAALALLRINLSHIT